MPIQDPFARLSALCGQGHLRFVYVVGVARSNSTVVCKVLGERLDGAVYEPATPNSAHLRNHYAKTILDAYEAARVGKAETEPVLLAIKDLSLFLDAEGLAFVLAHAEHVVFTVRDPLTQFPSLVNQFKHEFSIGQRLDALVRYPVEVCFLGYYAAVLGAGFVADAARTFGFSLGKSLLLTVAGWNLKSWRNVTAQFEAALARLGPDRVSVLDAGLMRLLPDAATASLEAIAARMRGSGTRTTTPVERAGHSRMFPRSAWAGEALHSHEIKPLAATGQRRRPKDSFEEKLLAGFYPDYGRLFFHTSNDILAEARAARRAPGAEQLAHLLDSGSAGEALDRLLGGRRTGASAWETTPAEAAE